MVTAVNHQGIILHIIIVLINASSIALNASRDTLRSISTQLQHQGN